MKVPDMNNYKKKIVGEGVIVDELKYTKMRSKNVHREIIERQTTRAYILECGHKEYFRSNSAKTAHCHECWKIDNI
jgi:mRNA deadenylase 3'-5' endonuclease subunit Ccr4